MGQELSCAAKKTSSQEEDFFAASFLRDKAFWEDTPDIVRPSMRMLGKEEPVQRFGAGVNIVQRGSTLVVAGCAPGGASERAGVLIGDVLHSIEEEDVRGQSVAQICPKILGPLGSTLTLKFQGSQEEGWFAARAMTFTILREPLPL